ncbi:branched-chain amino acid transport system substrate-binding protein [Paenalcaligenes hominis]|uniref:Branched-chain amino acid transport system substrate-binding protein n=1 Tax=Paenalcaligenes hominis TaxID=643674 RepID=A0ABX0WSL6_9BURK|nr:ABC transporter substrate-binding protein [Paenalcaligenes hominis]NJB65757.1 branched-chain amino acid transport system substrate-binding protein [Paenalcaligenes hominis]GGE69457.1 ABC transporter substrate-binding protein [Paenalcaligenes hominis]
MKKHVLAVSCTLALGVLTLSPTYAQNQDPLKIGIIATYSGPYADYGKQFDAGMNIYLEQNEGKLGGRSVEIIRKDTGGAAPDNARRFAQELISRDKVDIISGLDFSPNVYAIAPVINRAKVPTLVMNAASSAITEASPYIARLSFTVQQVSAPMAEWLAANNVKKIYTVVADYASGVDAEEAFKKAFEAKGGQVVGSVRTPMNNPDFSAYIQRIKDSQPEGVFIFFPSGVMPLSFLKAWQERGMEEAGIKLYATGEATDDSYIEATGDAALGLITSHHYSYAHPSPENQQFVEAYRKKFGTKDRLNYFAITAYDTMAALDKALTATQGNAEGDALLTQLKGMELMSPRGPITIDPETRDIIQTVYIRKVEQREGELVSVEFDQFDQVKDPAKEK